MAEQSSGRAAPRRWWRGIRPRLIAVLLIPMVAALALGALRVETAVAASREASRAESLASALPDAFRLAIQLTVERDSAGSGIPAATREDILAETDEAIDAWRDSAAAIDYSEDPELEDDLTAASAGLGDIDALREEIVEPGTRAAAVESYTDAINTLFRLATRLPELGDPSIYAQADALAEVRTASEVLGVVRVVVGQALMTREISPEGLMQLAGAQSVWDRASVEFVEGTSPAAAERFEELADRGPTSTPTPLTVMDQVIQEGGIEQLGLTAADWMKVYGGFVASMEEVIVRAADDLAADVTDLRDSAQQTAYLTAGIVLLVLVAALVLTLLAARSILRPLVRLRQAALQIAGKTLPERVAQIASTEGPVDTSVKPIGVTRRDEIGEVAEAFDAVHAEAVRLAGEQAQMRANVNRMFVNLSRRSQNLVERQLRLIDDLEAGEQDPAQLANLFRLDNLATRMRRNDESLLVLAGGDTGQAGRGNVPALDVLRAATSEIEQFARVEVDSSEVAEVRGSVAGDLVHLLAELIENATNFSPPETPVVVRTLPRHLGEPLIVEIQDDGIGMTSDELLAANTKLRSTSGLDADVARMMGLVVTARLADRHGMSVELRDRSPRGVIARVEIPTSALTESQTRPLPVVTVTAPRESIAPAPAAMPVSAAAFGGAGRAQAPAPAPAPTAPQPTAPVYAGDPRDAEDRLGADDGLGADDARDDDTPIFAAIQSEWFIRRMPVGTRREASDHVDGPDGPDGPDGLDGPLGWSSPGDDGWKRAADVSRRPEPELVTAGGLPKRVPGQNLLPGTAPAASSPIPQTPRPVDPRRSGALSSFQRGVSRARVDAAPDPSRSESEQDT